MSNAQGSSSSAAGVGGMEIKEPYSKIDQDRESESSHSTADDETRYPPKHWCTKPLSIIGVQEDTPVAFTPDGKYLAFVSGNRSIYIMELMQPEQEGAPRHFVLKNVLAGHNTVVRDVLFHPTEPTLVSCGVEGIFVWNWETGKLTKRITQDTNRDAHESRVECLEWVCQARLLVSGSKDLSIRVWNAQDNFKFVEALWGHKATILTLANNETTNTLASSGRDSTIKLWDLSNVQAVYDRGEELTDDSIKIVNDTDISGHRGDITTLTWKENGEVLFSGARDNEIKMWHVATSNELRCITSHKGDIRRIALLNDESMMMTASGDATCRLWKLLDFELPEVVEQNNEAGNSLTAEVVEVDFLSTPVAVELLDSVTQADELLMTINAHEDDIATMEMSPDRSIMVTASTWNTVHIWDLSQNVFHPRLIQTFMGHKAPIMSVKLIHNDSHVLSGSEDFSVLFSEWRTGRSITKLPFGGSVYEIDTNVDQTMVFAAGSDYDIRGVSLENGNNLFKNTVVFQGHCGKVEALAVSPDRTTMASAAHDFNIILWPLKDSYPMEENSPLGPEPTYVSPASTTDAHSGHVKSLKFNESGSHLASVGTDHMVQVWKVKSRKISSQWYVENAHESVISACCWGKGDHSEMLATCSWDHNVKVWSPMTKNKTPTAVLKGHSARVTDVDTSNSGRLLCSAGSDCTVRVWDMSDFSCLVEYVVHSSEGSINSLSVASTMLVTGSDNGMIRTWPLPTQEYLDGGYFTQEKPHLEDDTMEEVAELIEEALENVTVDVGVSQMVAE